MVSNPVRSLREIGSSASHTANITKDRKLACQPLEIEPVDVFVQTVPEKTIPDERDP